MSQALTDYMIDYALNQGINQFDTANLYAKGDAEIALVKRLEINVNRWLSAVRQAFN